MGAACILGRYDAAALRALFVEAGVFGRLVERGFTDLDVTVERTDDAPPHTRIHGSKGGGRFVLLDAIVVETVVPVEALAGSGLTRPLELAVVSWLREEDPTIPFSAARPALPLQDHPGLGILRRAFRVIAHVAQEVGKDGVGSVPKFFHDAVIFFRSRLFLFLDPVDQGRFEALVRDLQALPLGDASLALIGGCVRDDAATVVPWNPGLLVFPLSAVLTAYFHSPGYARGVEASFAAWRFRCDEEDLARVRALLTPAMRVG